MPGYDNTFIQVESLSFFYASHPAVQEVTFTVGQGMIAGLGCSDGAGKSTLLRMMATMLKPAAGRISLDGLDVVQEKKKVKSLIGYMPQRFGLYQDLTVGENLDFFMDIFGITGAEKAQRRRRYLEFANLASFIDRPGLLHRARLLAWASPAELRSSFPNLEEAVIHHLGEADRELVEDRFHA